MKEKLQTEIRCLEMELDIYNKKVRETTTEIERLKREIKDIERKDERAANLAELGVSGRVLKVAEEVVARCAEVKRLSKDGPEDVIRRFYKLNCFVRFGKLPRLYSSNGKPTNIEADHLVSSWAYGLICHDTAKKSADLVEYSRKVYENARENWLRA